MNGNKSFAVDTSHSLGTNVLSIGVGVVSSIFIARLLGPQHKGNYDLIIATSGLLNVMLGFSLASGISFIVASGKTNLRKLSWCLGMTVFIQVVTAYAILGLGGKLGVAAILLPSGLDGPVVGATVLLFGFQIFRSYWRSMLIGMQKIIFVNRCDLSARIISLAIIMCISVGSALLRQPVPAMVIVLVSVFAAGLGSVFYFRRLSDILKNSAGSSRYSSVVKYSLPSYIANTAQFLSYRADIFLVNWFWDTSAVGLYVLAVNIAELVWLLPGAAATALFPKVAATQTESRKNVELASAACRFALWLSVGVAVVLGICAYPAIPIVYGEPFRESRTPFLLLLPGVIGFSVVTVLAAYIAGMGKPQTNMLVSLLAAFITITGDLLLIPRYGIAGAALASSISYLLSAVMTAVIFIGMTKVRLRSIIALNSNDIKLARGWIRYDAVKQARYLLGIGN